MNLNNDGIPAQIVPMVLQEIKRHLETTMMEEVPENDPTRVVLTKIGRFQDNPLEKNVSVSISGGDFEDPKYLDARIDNPGMTNFPILNLPVGEIGGGEYWYRRGTINFMAFFVRQRYTEDVAMNYAYDFYGRLLKNMESVPISDFIDDYGEGAASGIIVEGATLYESGGKDKFIWRGKLYFRFLTWRP